MIIVFILFPILKIIISFLIINKELYNQEIISSAFTSISKQHISFIFDNLKFASRSFTLEGKSSENSVFTTSLGSMSLNKQEERVIQVLNNIHEG
jgi:hypothetical protein